MATETKIRVTQTRGLSHKSEAQRLVIKGLGLRRIGHTFELRDTPAIRGMIMKVQHLVDVDAALPHVRDLRIVHGKHRARLAPRTLLEESSHERTPNLVVRFTFRRPASHPRRSQIRLSHARACFRTVKCSATMCR